MALIHDKQLGSAIGLALLLVACGCGKPTPREEMRRLSQVHNSAALYSQNCSGCHGADGKLGPAPPLNDPIFLAIVPPVELRKVISEGRHGTMMPAFAREQGGTLTPLQVEILIDGMQRWFKTVPDAQSLPTYLPLATSPPGGTDAAATEIAAGGELFAKHCASCHGDQGQGGMGGALHVPAFLALVSDQALRRIIITGRPDLGMPDYRARAKADGKVELLTTTQINQIVALLASWREHAPAPPPAEQAMR